MSFTTGSSLRLFKNRNDDVMNHQTQNPASSTDSFRNDFFFQTEVQTSDDNWMHCYSCSFQYCYLCGQPCFGLYHFNEKYGCKKSSSLRDDAKLTKALRSDLDDL